MSWIPDWLIGRDRENEAAGREADIKNRQLTEELYAQGKIGSIAHEQARAHYDASDAEDFDAEIDGAFNDELSRRTGAVRNFAGGSINAILKSVFGTIPWQVWIAVVVYIAWRMGAFKSLLKRAALLALCSALAGSALAAPNNNIPPVALANVVYANRGDNLASLANTLRNDSQLLMAPVPFPITPSNNAAAQPDGPLRLIGKTNVTISGSGWGTKWIGANAGVFLVLSNCYNVTVKDFLIDGQWSGYTSNGINGIFGAIQLGGTNNFIRIQNMRFQNIPGFAVLTSYRGTDIDRASNLSILDCDGSNLGMTNLPLTGILDGGFFAGLADNLTISGFRVTDSVRFVELFSSATQFYTNAIIQNGTLQGCNVGVVTAAAVSGININNIGVKGGTNYPASAWLPQYGVVFQDPFTVNASVSGCQFHEVKGRAFNIIAGAGLQSNITFSGNMVLNGGNATLAYNGGVFIDDQGGNSVASFIYIRNNQFVNTVFQGLVINGGRDITVEGNAFIDNQQTSAGAGSCISFFAADLITNVVIRQNLFKNVTALRAGTAINIDAGSMNTRVIDNTITNMNVAPIVDASASTTVIGEPFGYSVTTNLASLAAGASTTIFIPAALSQSGWRPEVMIPPDFFGVTGGGDIATTAFCTNGNVTIRIVNNGAGAFDAPSTTLRAVVRAAAAY